MNPEPPPRRISQRDIAKHLGVSHVTVSMALRNNPRVSAKVREKIRQFAEQAGYTPDPMLAALSNYRLSRTVSPIHSAIAWINAWPRPEQLRTFKEFDCYWKGAFAAAGKFGYRLEEFRLGADITPKRLHQILTARGIRGLLLPPQKPHPDWSDFPWSEYYVVRFGRSLVTPNTHLVTADQVSNTMLAFDEILKLGYRRIGLITENTRIRESGHMFEGGFVLAQRNIENKHRVAPFPFGSFSPSQRGKAIAAWIHKNKVDAIFTDVAEIPVLLAKAGIKIPDDVGLAVTSVLDTNADSGINQQPEEIGRVGFLMLNSVINDGAKGIPAIFRQILVEGSWVGGNSLPDRLIKGQAG
ncbi:MAG: LacI family DNA-binding transcriptional regulator [Verrucomicrobiota bacterium]